MPVIMPTIRNLTGNTTLNVHYGPEAPADTSKLWVKRSTEAISASVGVQGLAAVAQVEKISATTNAFMMSMGAATVGTKIYLFGGSVWNNRTNTIQVFDTETETIETLATTLPAATSGIGAAAVGTKVYLFGGFNGSQTNTIQVFDTVAGTLETHSKTLNFQGNGIGAVAVGTKIYIIGAARGGSNPIDQVYVFDTEAGSYASVRGATFPQPIAYAAAVAVGAKIYVFGGNNSYSLSNSNLIDDIYIFDTEKSTVEESKAKLPSATCYISAAAIGTKVYLFGGYTYSGGFKSLNTVQEFDTDQDTLTPLDATLSTAKCSIAVGTVGINTYLFGGANDAAGSTRYNHIEHAKVFTRLDQDTAYLHASATENVFPMISGDYPVTLGVKAVYVGDTDDAAEQQEAYLYDETTSEWKPI